MHTFRNLASMTAMAALTASALAFTATPAGAVAPPEDSKRFEQSMPNSGPDWQRQARADVNHDWRNGDGRATDRSREAEDWLRGVENQGNWQRQPSGQHGHGMRQFDQNPQARYDNRDNGTYDRHNIRAGYDRRAAANPQYRGTADRDGMSYSRQEHEQRLRNLQAWQNRQYRNGTGNRDWQDTQRWQSERQWQNERHWREMQAWRAEQRLRQEEAFRRGYEAGRAYESGHWQDSYDPWRMREYTHSGDSRNPQQQWNDRAPGWQARQDLSANEYGAWRDSDVQGDRAFRAAPGTAAGNYRNQAPQRRNEGSWDDREFRAYPGVQSGNYR